MSELNIPKHVAIIMDGNGRWARQQGKDRSFGHKNGVKPLRACIQKCADLGIKYLTVYSFSIENWKRPKEEVSALMDLLSDSIENESDMIFDNKIRINIIGDLSKLPADTKEAVDNIMEGTKNHDRLVLNIALSYSSKWEILNATKALAQKVASNEISIDQIDDELFSNHLTTAGMPDPDLMIRSGGETRISNYLMWQLAYAELYFTDVLWPDFDEQNFQKAIEYYSSKERRFGKTGDQVKK